MKHLWFLLCLLLLALPACGSETSDDDDTAGGLATLEVLNATESDVEAVEVRACGDDLGIEVSGPLFGESVLIENLDSGCWQGRAGYPAWECWAGWNELGDLPAGEVTTWEVIPSQVVDCWGR
jgi:hypothetical protein